jgi:hypothetical protein
MKTCKTCGIEKPLEAFYAHPDTKLGVGTHCKKCISDKGRGTYDPRRGRESYARRRDTILARLKKVRDDRKMEYIELLNGRCRDCGIKPGDLWPVDIFDFHHLDSESKDIEIGPMLKKKNQERVLLELKKCVLLCANCHRRRHAWPEFSALPKE